VAWKASILVLANQTAPSDELLEALQKRGDASFTLIVPTTPFTPGAPSGRDEAEHNLELALERLHEAGVEVEGRIGDSDPITAVHEVWDPRKFDEIIVSTLPTGTSRWLRIDIPRRLQKLTDAPVTHVVGGVRHEPVGTGPAPEHDKHGVLTPLFTLSWGKKGGPEEASKRP
jgi:hypothetical protein